METRANAPYDPKTTRLLTFYDAVPAFAEGSDTPRAYLERCIETIEAREPEVKGFVVLNLEGSRRAADASSERYRAGRPLSPVDGMPIAIKDLYETEDMPTQMGSPLYKGYESHRDCAVVYALRQSGASIIGKAVTTEFGFYHPGPTTNPFDSTRTPGGSSSGSGAVVGAAMVPAAIGSQVASSLIRPASFSANVGFKPSFGALTRLGGHSNLSQSCIGPQAGCLEDAWAVAYQIASVAGGDPGHPGLYGERDMAAPVKPARLARLDTDGWAVSNDEVRGKLEDTLAELARLGVEIVDRTGNAKVAALETALEGALEVTMGLCGYELRWPLNTYRDRAPELLSDDIAQRLVAWEKLTVEDYRRAMARRQDMRAAQAALAGEVDAFVTLSAVGAAPVGIGSTANPVYGIPSSILGAPALSLPLLEIEGMPLGLQLVGFIHEDAKLFAIANWVMRNFGRDA